MVKHIQYMGENINQTENESKILGCFSNFEKIFDEIQWNGHKLETTNFAKKRYEHLDTAVLVSNMNIDSNW